MRAYFTIIKTKSKVDSQGRYRVRLCFVDNNAQRKYLEINEAHNCLPHQFDDAQRRFTKHFPNYRDHNTLLNEIEEKAQKIIAQNPNKLDFKTFVSELLNLKQKLKLDEAFLYFEKKLQDKKKIGTATTYHDTRLAFNKFKKGVYLTDITPQFLENFEVYHLAKNNKKGGCASYMRTLRSMLNQATREGLYESTNYPFGLNGYSIQTRLGTSPEPIFVARNIIDILHNADIAYPARLNQLRSNAAFARDVFLFSYYTRGMSFVDVCNARWEHVKEGRLFTGRQKVHKKGTLKLNAEALTIVAKYENYTEGYLFPIFRADTITDEQKHKRRKMALKYLNIALKKIKGLEHLNLSMSMSRDSFANEAKKRNVPTLAIKDMLMHESVKTTETYLKRFPDLDLDDYADDVYK
jgi:site-specific recombinase XerD